VPDATSIRAQLDRILSSSTFAKADRLGRFLGLAVEKALAGEDLKEYELGVEVCGRKSDFDPRVDSIVRVEAGRLRSKLREYYELQGADDPVRIVLPKGTYIPTFEAVAVDYDGRVGDGDIAATAKPALLVRWPWLIGAVAVLLVAVGSFWKLRTRPAALGPTAISSVAVLPFMSLGADESCQRFSDGLTEEITTDLARTSLQVPARTTAFQFKNKAVDVQEVGRKLKVDAVLEGSVRQEGDRFRVTVQLINVADGYHLWAETYERSSADSLSLQREISRTTTETLARRIAGEEHWRGRGQATPDPEALADYLEAYRIFDRSRLRGASRKIQSDELQRVLGLFKRATERDPSFALAWAGLADASEYSIAAFREQAAALEAQARQSVERALQLDDSIALAHQVLGDLRFFRDLDMAGAEAALRRAVEIDPRKPYSQRTLADVLRVTGRWQEASIELRRAMMLDPQSTDLRVQSALLLYDQHRFTEALAEGRGAADLEPSNPFAIWITGLCYERLAEWDKAERAYRHMLKLSPRDSRGVPALGYLLGRTGRSAEARRILESLVQEDQQGMSRAYAIALVHAGLGEKEAALDWLEKAYARRDSSLPYLKVEIRLEPLQSHPRFVALLRRMGLTAKGESNVTAILPSARRLLNDASLGNATPPGRAEPLVRSTQAN
jgi:TolB-like protein/Flp pilus assembly protein TadD